ncbi:MAG: hypothetical protein PHS41_10035, partial [Victivallaceae bacterium]|nr:hypothetical protein [Victivallaceae bacterium]
LPAARTDRASRRGWPFEVTLDRVTGKLSVAPGFLRRNGEFLRVKAVEGIPPATGFLCVVSTLTDGTWSDPAYAICSEPDETSFPIAEIAVDADSGDVTITQYPVTAALILQTKGCPLQKG